MVTEKKGINIKKRISKSGLEYISYSMTPEFIIGGVNSESVDFTFSIQNNFIQFYGLFVKKELEHPQAIKLIEENEEFAQANKCEKISYLFPSEFVPLCSHGGIENKNPLKRFLRQKNYKIFEDFKFAPSYASKEIK